MRTESQSLSSHQEDKSEGVENETVFIMRDMLGATAEFVDAEAAIMWTLGRNGVSCEVVTRSVPISRHLH